MHTNDGSRRVRGRADAVTDCPLREQDGGCQEVAAKVSRTAVRHGRGVGGAVRQRGSKGSLEFRPVRMRGLTHITQFRPFQSVGVEATRSHFFTRIYD